MPLDENDIKTITDLFSKGLEAHSAQNPGLTAEQVQKIVDDKLGGVNEQIAKLNANANDKGKGKGKGKGEDEGDKGNSENEARLAALEAKQTEIAEREAAAIQRERNNALRGSLAAALKKHGVPEAYHDQAIAFLKTKTSSHSGKPMLDFDDNDRPVFIRAGKGYDDTISIEEGIKDWAGTDEAKLYKPPADRKGVGAGPGNRPTGAGGRETSTKEIIGRLQF